MSASGQSLLSKVSLGGHRRSQVVHLHPQGGEKKIRPNLRGKFVSASPGTFLLGGGGLEVCLYNIRPSFEEGDD